MPPNSALWLVMVRLPVVAAKAFVGRALASSTTAMIVASAMLAMRFVIVFIESFLPSNA